ncbi:hypothetical protein DL98DRAFT_632553 [Cadophora sp. DSE1049]|nr:hypothetical protein DL98DRAFT_632553 [Cadophora sp. DSE1049]
MARILAQFLYLLAYWNFAAAACHRDNVYRGLVRDYRFCSGLLAPTKIIYPTPANVATYPASRITSACSCIVTDFKPTWTSSQSSNKVIKSSTISTTQPLSTSSRSSIRSTVSTLKSSSSLKSATSSSRTSTKSSSSTRSNSSSKPTSSMSSQSSSRSTSKPSSSQPSSTRQTSTTSRSSTSSRVSSSSQSSSSSGPALTGITIKPYVSKTGCYHLPTPTAELQVASIDTTGATPPYIESIFLDATGVTAVYLLIISTDGKKYIHDISDPDKYAIVDEEGNAMYADSTGIHFTTNTCSVVIDIEVDNFLQQAEAFKTSPPTKRHLVKRTKETIFNVIAQLTDQCGQKVTDLAPSVDVGISPCDLIPGSGGGQFSFNCQFPGENSLSMLCEAKQQRWIDSLTTGVVGSSTGWAAVWLGVRFGLSAIMTRAYFQGIVLAALIATGALLGSQAIAVIGVMLTIFNVGLTIFTAGTTALSGIQAMITYYNKDNPDKLKEDICKSTRLKELPLPLTLSAGNTKSSLITSLSIAPTTFIPTSKQIQDPKQTACCPSPGVCRAYSSCGSSCICGTTSDAKGVCYFGNNPCTSYSRCSSNAECGTGVCIVNNCCDYGVCVDPYTCSSLSKKWEWDLMARNESVGVLTPNGWM